MQVVIDIPETVYYMAQRTNILEADIERLTETIKNGTPLPKAKWKFIGNNKTQCSNCKTIYSIFDTQVFFYCPTCGSKTESEET